MQATKSTSQAGERTQVKQQTPEGIIDHSYEAGAKKMGINREKLTGYHIVWNSVTGLKWDGKGFNSRKVGKCVSLAQLQVLKHTFLNVESFETSY